MVNAAGPAGKSKMRRINKGLKALKSDKLQLTLLQLVNRTVLSQEEMLLPCL